MNLEQTIKDTIVSESHDLDGRLQQLVRAGLMPANTIPILRKAIGKVQGGMTLQGAERDVMANFINSMMFIVLGDDAIFNRARTGAKSYAVEETDLEENAKIVAHLSKRYGDNIRKSHVMSAAKDFGVDASKLSKAVRKHLDKTMLPEAKEKQEYDYEGDMAMGQLKSIIANSQRMHDMLSDDTNLPEWVQSKITLAEDYISTASNYMQGEMNEEQIDELSHDTLRRYRMKAKSIGDNEKGDINYRAKGRELAGRKTYGGRMSGIEKAKVMAKEEVEITEASVADVAKTAHLHVRAGKHDSIHTAIQSAVNTHFPSSVHSSVTRKKVAAQALSRIQSMNKSKMTKEEVEQVDEVSKRTLGRYINKAKDSIDMTSYRSGIKDGTAISSSTPYKSNNPLEKKLSKRHKGIETAVKKLTKEDIDAVKKMNESYKTAFESALNEYGIKSPSELDESKRKEFFNHVDLEFKKGDN